MSTFRNPVGPQSPQTYWRRRLIVLLGLIALIVVVVLIVAPRGPDTSAANKPDTSDSKADAASDAPAPDDGVCDPAAITVAAITDAIEYVEAQQPLLSLSITNTGKSACTFSAGSDVQEYVITSGDERIWSSKDCQSDAVAVPQVLEPGVAVTTTPFAWDRTRSDPTTCDSADRPQVTAGGATYHLGVAVNGVESADTRRFALN